jgi:hypothetical protein
MNEWLEQFQFLVNKAAVSSGLPERKGGGFDGEGWAWIWLDRNEKGEETQVQLRAVPTVQGDRIDIQVFASAWTGENPEDSWSRIYTSYIQLKDGRVDDTLEAVNKMLDVLKEADRDVRKEGIASLGIMRKHRVELIENLRKRKILEPQSNYKNF